MASPAPTSQETSTSAGIGTGQRPVKSQHWKHHMQIIRKLKDIQQISKAAIRELVRERINDLPTELR